MFLPNGPHGMRALIDRACAQSDVALSASVETNAMSVQKSLVLGGHGFTILPPISFAQELASGQLTGAPLGDPAITRTVVLALPAHRAVSRPVRHVMALLMHCTKEAVQGQRWPEAQWIAQ